MIFIQIVHCNADADLDYRINVGIPQHFIPDGSNVVNITATAILSYHPERTKTQINYAPSSSGYAILNDLADQLFEYQLRPLQSLDAEMALPADERIILQHNVVWAGDPGWPLEEWVVNDTKFIPPSQPLLQADYFGIPLSSVLNYEQVEHMDGDRLVRFTRATNVIKLTYGKVYEFTMFSDSAQQHPWHIHGSWVNFTSVGKDQDFQQVPGYSPNSFATPSPILAISDSFTVPRNGFVTFRFKAENPGPWMLHCHVDWHLKQGRVTI
jgi:hypothetical protein